MNNICFSKKIFGINLQNMNKTKNLTNEAVSKQTEIKKNTILNYTSGQSVPSLENLRTLSSYYGVSIDYLFLGEKNPYPSDIYLLNLAEKIDKLDEIKRLQVESTILSLIDNPDKDCLIKTDDIDFKLSESFNSNLKEVRKFRGFTQQKIGDSLGSTRKQIYFYEYSQVPSPDRLIQLSDILNVSIHALITGIRLDMNQFNNNSLREAALKADKFLDLENKRFLATLMEKIINKK